MKFFVVLILLCYSSEVFSQTRQNRVLQSGESIALFNMIVVKFKADFFNTNSGNNSLLDKINGGLKQSVVRSLSQEFPQTSALRKGSGALNRIFNAELSGGIDPYQMAKQISSLPEVEWAEPKYLRKVCYNVNDEYYVAGKQQHLDVVKAKEAWEFSKGNNKVIIGIIDTGIDIDHPDLAANIFINENEVAGNQKDEDDNGNFTDDINGWDFGGERGIPDNDPREDYSIQGGYHGTHTAGIAAAVTDNSIGIASIGYNCAVLPVKASQGNYRDENDKPYIIYGFEGIKYAVDKGAKIISCSWGGYEYSKFEQEIIDYAVSNNVLVVAAAGNDNSQKPFYPASYNGVLSVGWTNNEDIKVNAANYGEYVDICAPGTAIYSTWSTISGINPAYKTAGGSSMSAPLVAGLAGLVISKFTNITTQQLVERIRATCDQIEDKNLSNYKYLLGSGRINAQRAVGDEKIFSLRATNAVFGVVNSSVPNDDDTIRVELEFTNFLTPISNVKISLSCRDSFVRFINNQLEIGSLHELEKTKAQSIFFVLDNYAPTDTSIFILVKYEAAGYFDFQWLPVKINPSFVTLNNDKIEVSVTNKGGIGYSDLSHLRGVGFRTVNGNNFLSEGAQMIGTSADKLIDGVRINSISISSDLTAQKSISLRKNNLMSESFAYFNDNNSGTSRLGIQTRVHSYIFNTAPDNSYLLFEVTIKNITLLEIKNLYLGYFLDINLSDDGLSDSTSYDNTDKFAYVINKNSHNGIVGAALLTNQKDCYAGINNNWHVGEMILADGFQDEEKWYSISNGILKEKVFGNVSFTVGGGPVSVLPSGEETFAFVVAPASSKEELRQIIRQSRKKYITLDVMNEKIVPLEYKLYQNYPNPFNPSTTIQYSIPVVGTKSATTTHVTLKVYDVLGREIATLVDEDKSPGTYEVQFNTSNAEPKRTIPTGVYFYRLQTGDFIQTKKMILLK